MEEKFKRLDEMSEDEKYALAYERAKGKRNFYIHSIVFFIVNIMLWGDYLFLSVTGIGKTVWFITFGWAIGLACHGMQTLAPLNQNSIQKEYEKLNRKSQQNDVDDE